MNASFFRIFNAIVLWVIVILFLPKKSFKRFLPVTLFCSCILLVQTLLNTIFKWWKVEGGIKYMVFDALAFIFGPFFTINLWVFHFTNGRFLLYSLVNLIIDLIFSHPLNSLFQKIGHYQLKKFNSTILFIISFSLALLNYAFQKFIEKPKKLEMSPKISE
ncbi:hypothetical protein CHN50_00890 [Priestia aryabhattai]|uniref:hypothetical protein n=1 Tax=Priestia TaxID=2800373 RepID=UPI000BA028FA|nr:hypothetical protein CHN50_00890 [Priestia aryabhattai]USY56625.1 hypothetical protein NIZ91_08210 [Bacillus sp. 1780r2a1]